MIKIAHEAPISFMNKVQNVTDYDYALACLFDKIPGYYEYFVEALKNGRHVLLDNGVFEDGVPMDAEQYAKWIEKLNPTEYIVPDEFDKKDITIDHFYEWNKRFCDLPGKKIGVVQGANFNEWLYCYDYMAMNADKVAINFASAAYQKFCNDIKVGVSWDTKVLWGRVTFLHLLFNHSFFRPERPMHLLGCVLPSEFTILKQHKFKNKRYLDYFETMDTSAPIVWGLLKGEYPYDLDRIAEKVKTKIKDLITVDITEKQSLDILKNIALFRQHLV